MKWDGTEDYRRVQGEKKMRMLVNITMNINRNVHPSKRVRPNKQMLLPSWMHEVVFMVYLVWDVMASFYNIV